MNTIDEPLLAAIQEMKPAPCIFNESLDIADEPIDVPAVLFSNVHRSLLGIQAISQILAANGIAEENSSHERLNGFLVGGLTSAIQMLSEFSVAALEEVVSRRDRERREVNRD